MKQGDYNESLPAFIQQFSNCWDEGCMEEDDKVTVFMTNVNSQIDNLYWAANRNWHRHKCDW